MSQALSDFFAAWAETDADGRGAMIARAIGATIFYADPMTETPITDAGALSDYVGNFAKSAPGALAEVAKAEDRAGVTRATVVFRMPNGMEQLGQYFAEHDDAGRLTRLIGFVGTGAPE